VSSEYQVVSGEGSSTIEPIVFTHY